ncbi:MAG: HAMP domain-containing sensor histidine kinase [Candidatus Hydrogenedentes bacterium]|nr:HAMP domain-containing sensor histidine kinase [Candidatus Hydrogenedentota bacterium]
MATRSIPAHIAPNTDPAYDRKNFLLHKRLLGERLHYYCLARFVVVAAIAGSALAARYLVGISGLEISRLMIVAGVLGLYNLMVFFMVRPFRDPERAGEMHSLLVGITHGTIMLDFFFLTVVLWLLGGARSPLLPFYLFNLIIASVLLSRVAAICHASMAYLLLAGLILGEWLQWIPAQTPGGAVLSGELDGRYVLTLLAVYGVLFALSSMMLTSLMQLLRKGERELRSAKAESERLADLRREILHIALHDLKSPVVAVAQHLYNLAVYINKDMSEQENRCLTRCHLRLREQLQFLHDLEMLASLETSDLRGRIAPVNMTVVLENVVDENLDLAQARGVTIDLEPLPDLPDVPGIPRLLHEAVANFVTNAIKYSPRGSGRILVRATTVDDRVRVEVEDNGIGIAEKDLDLLFQEFVRLPRRHKEVDDSVSSGLGLSIVRRIAEQFGGEVGVRSEPNKGSIFFMDLPLASAAVAPNSDSAIPSKSEETHLLPAVP